MNETIFLCKKCLTCFRKGEYYIQGDEFHSQLQIQLPAKGDVCDECQSKIDDNAHDFVRRETLRNTRRGIEEGSSTWYLQFEVTGFLKADMLAAQDGENKSPSE